jgi:hypothetical protein
MKCENSHPQRPATPESTGATANFEMVLKPEQHTRKIAQSQETRGKVPFYLARPQSAA